MSFCNDYTKRVRINRSVESFVYDFFIASCIPKGGKNFLILMTVYLLTTIIPGIRSNEIISGIIKISLMLFYKVDIYYMYTGFGK